MAEQQLARIRLLISQTAEAIRKVSEEISVCDQFIDMANVLLTQNAAPNFGRAVPPVSRDLVTVRNYLQDMFIGNQTKQSYQNIKLNRELELQQLHMRKDENECLYQKTMQDQYKQLYDMERRARK